MHQVVNSSVSVVRQVESRSGRIFFFQLRIVIVQFDFFFVCLFFFRRLQLDLERSKFIWFHCLTLEQRNRTEIAVMGVAQYIKDNKFARTSATLSLEFASSITHRVLRHLALVLLVKTQLLS